MFRRVTKGLITIAPVCQRITNGIFFEIRKGNQNLNYKIWQPEK